MVSRSTDIENAALKIAAHGWHVFLLGRSKRPVANCADCRETGPEHDRQACECLTCHGFYAATTDSERIRAMVATVPNGLLAIRTGAVSGIVVVDIDPDHGGVLAPDLMPRTAAVATGGHGWHLYYRYPDTPITSRPLPHRPGVDIKADGGYVVAPPSIHPRTKHPYRWVGGHGVAEMAPALLDLCQAEGNVQVSVPTRPAKMSGEGAISSPSALLAAHLDAVARAPKGRRRTTLYGAARGIARMVAAGALQRTKAWAALTEAGKAAEQNERQIREAIIGGFRAEGVQP